MAKQAWFGGAANFTIGQADIAVKKVTVSSWDTGTGWQTLGRVDHINFNEMYTWGPMKSLQTGDDEANAQIIGQSTNAEVGLVEMYAEVYEQIWPGAVVKRDGGDVVRIYSKKMQGVRLTDLLMWVRITKYKNGAPSTDVLDTIYSLMAPRLESGEINSDLSQQVITLPFKGFVASEDYVTPAVTDADDEYDTPLSFWTAEVA